MTDTSCLNVNKKGRQGTPSAPWDLERARFRLNITKKTDSGIRSVGPSQQPSHVQEKRVGLQYWLQYQAIWHVKRFFIFMFYDAGCVMTDSMF
ncbi:hypothetical protein TNCT_377031 [Trichonephila clavata]|uniref:Uncharacterized protein n=1 Tax=Trichonephila clavata TaxID=2740835 RepID=A0A8X6F3M6_TRICU|nr:hypothetical protein TNCT_377031 [Trichonephila clavata]